MDNVIIRNATIHDLDSITEIYNDSIQNGTVSFDEPPINKTRYEAYVNGQKKRSCLLVAENNSYVLGWTLFDPISERSAYRFTCLGSTYVRKDFKNKKIGTLLKEQQFENARKLGYHSIVGEVLKINRKGIDFLLKFGYEIIGELREAGFRNNNWISLVIFQKFL